MFCRFFLFVLLSTLPLGAAELPAYLKTALARFAPEIPADYAYTVTTQRGDEISVERFDPSRSLEQQWTLLQRNQKPATAEENARYTSYRITTSPTARATFRRGDIDLGSLHLVRETETQAVFQGHFREELTDPMLHHLDILLTVAKPTAAIKQYVLQLIEPFSPVLTIKMLELRVETTLTSPPSPGLTLPQHTTSRFRGRIMIFKSIEEDIQTDYSDFVQITPIPVQPPNTAP